MCTVCSDAYAEFSTSTWRKARKPHRCDECYGTIAKGDRYERTFGKFEGDWFVNALCAKCSRMWSVHFTATRAIKEDCSPPLGELREAIGECSRENPEYRAAFAAAWKVAA